ncbi:MAG TPA: hypothetical protein VNM92_10245 [Thermoanaerobaculia bacterium]|nr:hypothetical protein [Thermoanaerobaculia bacterium]
MRGTDLAVSPSPAVIVPFSAWSTGTVVIVNGAEVWPDETAATKGMVTDGPKDLKRGIRNGPPLIRGAGPESVTVPMTAFPPTMAPGDNVNPESTGGTIVKVAVLSVLVPTMRICTVVEEATGDVLIGKLAVPARLSIVTVS